MARGLTRAEVPPIASSHGAGSAHPSGARAASLPVRRRQLRDDPATIDNLCEPAGDTLQIGSFQARIGFITPKPDALMATSIEITLADPVPTGAARPTVRTAAIGR